MKGILSFSFLPILLVLLFFCFSPVTFAADIRANNTIIIPRDGTNLKDLYLFGRSIDISAPVINDLVAAGGDITVNNNVSGDVLAAGGTLRLKGNSGGSVRVVGGNVIIEGTIARDLVVAGGNVTIAKSAIIAGDLIAAGGEINIDGVVKGYARVNGGQVYLDGKVGKQVEGNMSNLTLGPNAIIAGDLIYSSQEKVTVENGALVLGTERYTHVADPRKLTERASFFFTGLVIYRLIIDIIISLALVYFFAGMLKPVINSIKNSPVQNGVYGLAFLILVPIVSIFLLFLILLGIASFLFYALILIVSIYIAKIFLGWLALRWWYRRNKIEYILDWKAAVLGPVALFIIAIIPVIGWLINAILHLISIGAVIRELAMVTKPQRISLKTRAN